MAERTFTIEKAGGNPIHAFLYSESQKGDNMPPIVILCHGFSGDHKEWGRFTQLADELVKNNSDVLLFDFTGSGKNVREPILLSEWQQDLKIVYDWVRSQGYSMIGCLGLSLGGLTLLTTVTSALDSLKAIVFWAPALYLKKAMKKWQIFFAKFAGLLFPNKIIKQGNSQDPSLEPVLINSHFIKEIHSVRSDEYLQKLTLPVLIVQGTADNQVKAELNYKAMNFMPKDADHVLHKVESATHDFSGKHLEEFIKVTVDWFKKYLK